MWAEYSCDEFKYIDYKVGLGALAGIHNAQTKNAQSNVIAYNKDTFSTFSGYVNTTYFWLEIQ
ncbi:hypothetical protein OQH61_02415 [Helicobacter sp. MIT 21-1697]|uniref:hypothetical protein n=1 Tax=Helicobacter sp. MIT 21-1697 TaxID=2993733 RepID=UPI00224AE49F|nr:hypothetical protein [Helicobacter sp. MIT 21-1697]MCX2716584.1 hypothetical protein [Helicobacter sp. MIT 21-1697]